MKIISVVGARPQFVKVAPVARAFEHVPRASHAILHTGQHYDENLSGVFFSELGIPPPAFELAVGSASHGAQTGRMLEAIERVFLAERPDWVVVYGDTNSTLAGALAAVKLHIKVAHVEAGLRSFNRAMPEEINRILTDHAADLLFAPTDEAVRHLRNEGFSDARYRKVGDVSYDAALLFGAKARAESRVVERTGVASKKFVLATIHRAENTDDPSRLRAIVEGLSEIARRMDVVLPLHPRTRGVLDKQGLALGERVHVIDPVGYLDMAMLELSAALIATDSGGVQKEAFYHGVPAVTLRDETEWTELVELGWNAVVPPRSADDVSRGILAALERGPGRAAQPYGDGAASARIVEALLEKGERR